jgi:hypothetical protein
MLSKELIQELKEAGFHIQTAVHVENKKGRVELIAPTLSELIEACPETLEEVGAPDGRFTLSWGYQRDRGNCWIAWYDVEGHTMGNEGYGDAPDEAVANLWLVLYGKSKSSKR